MPELFDMSYLGAMVDMAGCPNRCRHCWLSSHKNGNKLYHKDDLVCKWMHQWGVDYMEGKSHVK